MTRKPLVSVLMPYRKKDAFFASALESVESQTYSRIEILTEEDRGGEGITILLNRLTKQAKGEFLARMDADDISEPDRIEKQVGFLTGHPDVMLVGTWAALIDESGKKIGLQKMPVSWDEIREQAFFRNPLIHPSWMMRRKWFLDAGGYDEEFRYSQDWEFVLRRGLIDRMANIPEPLIKLRIHPKSSSFSANKLQLYFGVKARWLALRRGSVPMWKIIFLIPKLLSFFIPVRLKYLTRSKIFDATIVAPDILGIVLPMGQSKKHLEESGQWSLWESELAEYKKAFDGVELFEYRYSDWRRFVEAKLLPLIQGNRFRRCLVLKAVHLTGAIPCLVAKLLYGIPYVLSYGYRYDEFAALERKWGTWLFVKMLTPMAIKFADAVMVPTEELRFYVKNFGAKRIEVIPNGVDTMLFKGPTLSENRRVTVLFVGRLEKQKNLETLIIAISKLLKDPTLPRQGWTLKYKFVLVGSVSLRGEILELADKLEVNLEIIGPISNEKLPEVYRQADIFVLPSLAEGHPKALLEAMSCGLPCFASNISGGDEIIVDGKNGLLVEPTAEGITEGLRELMEKPELRKKLGTAARQTVIDRFDKKKLIKREIKILLSLIRPGLAAARPGL